MQKTVDDFDWEKKPEIHRQVTDYIQKLQREVGEDLLKPKDLATEYQALAKREATIERPRSRVGQIINRVLDSTQANITVGQIIGDSPLLQKEKKNLKKN